MSKPSNPFNPRVALPAGVAVLVLGALAAWTNSAVLGPPLGVSIYSALAFPSQPVNRPRNIIGGHVVGMLVGLLAFHLAGAAPYESAFGDSFTMNHALASALAVGISIAIESKLDLVHPPSLATTLVASLGLIRDTNHILGLMVGAVGVAVAVGIFRRSKA